MTSRIRVLGICPWTFPPGQPCGTQSSSEQEGEGAGPPGQQRRPRAGSVECLGTEQGLGEPWSFEEVTGARALWGQRPTSCAGSSDWPNPALNEGSVEEGAEPARPWGQVWERLNRCSTFPRKNVDTAATAL